MQHKRLSHCDQQTAPHSGRASTTEFLLRPGITLFLILFFLGFQFLNLTHATSINTNGHLKYQGLYSDSELDHSGDTRLNLSARSSNWLLQTDYQLLNQHRNAPTLPDDEFRLFDLTSEIDNGSQSKVVHRLDRLHLGYTSDQAVIRFGRQAISWGNGLTYAPMDFFNPFDPAAIDREYKTGDDMLYGQYSFDTGDDLQLVWVGRRDTSGDSNHKVASMAAKYHVFVDFYEIDFLLAEHFDQRIFAIGGLADIGGSVWRSDIVSTDTDDGDQISAVLNASWSWVVWERNMSGYLELYRNGFGIDDGDYSPANLSLNPELVARLQRGELFTFGKNYISASATIEMTPLWLLTTTLFNNLDDNSHQIQIISHHDLLQDLQVVVALNLPQGDNDSEFGRAEESVFAQIAWYF